MEQTAHSSCVAWKIRHLKVLQAKMIGSQCFEFLEHLRAVKHDFMDTSQFCLPLFGDFNHLANMQIKLIQLNYSMLAFVSYKVAGKKSPGGNRISY